MTPGQLKSEFTRVEHRPTGVAILVKTISWEGPHSPVISWVVARELRADCCDKETELAINEVLDNPSFFRACFRCSEVKPIGWMHSESVCQSCAERHLGVVH